MLTRFHNFDQISQCWPDFTIFTDITIFTRFYNFDQIPQFWPNFTILTRFHNFPPNFIISDQILQFGPNFTILTKFHNLDQISQFRPNFTILSLSRGPPGWLIHQDQMYIWIRKSNLLMWFQCRRTFPMLFPLSTIPSGTIWSGWSSFAQISILLNIIFEKS